MDWQERYFKGKKVWVKVDHLGDPVVESGRVEMRYQNSEDAKIYRASPANVSAQSAELVDATREFEEKLAGKKPASKSKSSSKSSTSGTKAAPGSITSLEAPERWGPRHESTSVPDAIASLEWPDEGIVEIYTDGACSGNPGPCGYGVVIRDGEHYREIGQYLGQGTNNIGELMGIKTALEAVDDRSRPVHLYTDSTYCIGVLTKGWKAKANRELILEIRALVATFSDLTFHKVKGHSDHPLNDRADFMATSSLEDAR
ncbi:ribonuclease HI [Lujinxingia sediminis]|nr:ribonuclease H [Lujinxingia sediminis]